MWRLHASSVFLLYHIFLFNLLFSEVVDRERRTPENLSATLFFGFRVFFPIVAQLPVCMLDAICIYLREKGTQSEIGTESIACNDDFF